jgi:KH domain
MSSLCSTRCALSCYEVLTYCCFCVINYVYTCIHNRVIGPGGKQIRQIIEEYALGNVEIAEDGTVFVSSMDAEANEKAVKFIQVFISVIK